MAVSISVGGIVLRCWVVSLLLGCGGKTSSIASSVSLGGSGVETGAFDAAGAPQLEGVVGGPEASAGGTVSTAPMAGGSGLPLDAGAAGTAGRLPLQSIGGASYAGSGATAGGRGGMGGGTAAAGTVSSAGGSLGTGGSAQKPLGTVLAETEQPSKLTISVNIKDGFGDPREDEVFDVDFGTNSIKYSHTIQREEPQTAVVQATSDQCQAIVDLLKRATYSGRGDCAGFRTYVDGSPFPPLFTLVVGEKTSIYSAAKKDCVSSDHSTTARVMSCDDYGALVELVRSIVGTSTSTYCFGYW